MLVKNIEEFRVANTVGEPVGKIKEAYIDLDRWEIVAFGVSPGALRKNMLVEVSEMEKLDLENGALILKDDHEVREVPKTPVKNLYPLKDLMDLDVVDADGEKIGRVYDLEVPYEKLKRLKVWKVLIRTGIKEKRLRLPPADIAEVRNEVHLKRTEKEYVEHAE